MTDEPESEADAGKQVLCEKPLALDAGEADTLVQHCRKRGVLLMEAFMRRHQPRTLELLELVQNGAIGELLLDSFIILVPDRGGRPGDSIPPRGGGSLF